MSEPVIAALIFGGIVYFLGAIATGDWVYKSITLPPRSKHSVSIVLGIVWPAALILWVLVGIWEAFTGEQVTWRWLP